MTPFMCRGCQQPIMERYLMKVLDKSWHMQCVKCCECQCVLSERCYSRDSKLYCRSDFFKLFGTKCSGCNTGLCPEDLVRHAMNKVYHVSCFTCCMCRKQLSTGEQIFFLQGDSILCKRCYQLTQSINVAKTSASSSPSSSNTAALKQAVDTPSPQVAALIPSPMQQQQQHQTPPPVAQPPNSDGRRSKTRTSINPQQLEVLVQAYNQEQRPSKLAREELMAKTGLDMKVIQVWFQNRRSKEKRDASYRDANREEISMSTPIVAPPTVIPQIPAATPPSLPMSLTSSPASKPSNGEST